MKQSVSKRLQIMASAAAALTCVSLTACGSSSTSGSGSGSGVIAIGVPLGLSSSLSAIDKSALVGIQLAVSQQNAKGGIKGHQIKLYVLDDAGTAEGAISAYEQLISERHVVGILGMVSTQELSPISTTAISRKQLVPIVGLAGPETIAKPGTTAYDWVYGDDINQADVAPEQVENLVNDLHITKIGVLYSTDPFGEGGLAAAQAEAKKLGASIVASEPLSETVSNMVAPLGALKNAGAQAILPYFDGTSAATLGFFNGRATLDWYPPVEMSDVYLTIAGIQSSNSLARNGYFYNTCNPLTSGFQTFQQETAKDLNFTGGGVVFAAADYVGAQVMFHAMSVASNPFSPAQVNSAIENQTKNFPSVCGTGSVTLSPTQHSFNPVVPIYTYKNGTNVYIVK
jgi:ABC-type branched-subunit amino acid transport system substrate-binding protein